MKTITNYLLDWNISSKKGKVILKFKDAASEEIMDDLDYETFSALAHVLGKGKAKYDPTDNSIFNVM
ncbi:hypothetical protein [Chryseobacterium paridis]|uniref:Uncharacterized protein n=1 Tax=Chryseobacterium paridis TaxID=2800328 RepID=A0ABS1FPE0_9FLAO|nr:hypothetical protein [Chryseobacterium paridis]MBK1894290.1 hypothetical protein [Chryseobacterium paridis]